MTYLLSEARSILLDPYNINDNDISHLLADLFSYGADMGDIYFQAINHESWSIEDGEVKNKRDFDDRFYDLDDGFIDDEDMEDDYGGGLHNMMSNGGAFDDMNDDFAEDDTNNNQQNRG